MAHRFRPLGAALAKITEPHFRARGFSEAAVLTHWSAIVGERLGRLSAPERLSSDGTLRLRVAGGAAPEFQHLEPQILERIASHFGYRAVHRLVLVQGPLPQPKESPAPALPELPPGEEARLAGEVEAVPQGQLRGALAALGRALARAGLKGSRPRP